jgi:hypothetical protein
MKKLFLLFMILGLTSITFIDLNASSYQNITLDTPINQLYGYTLRELFEDFNVVPNSRFDNNDTSIYNSFNTNIFSIENGVLYGQGDGVSTRAYVFLDILTIGEFYYIRYDIETNLIGNSSTRLYSGSLTTPSITGITSYTSHSLKGIADNYRLMIADWRYDYLNQDDEILRIDNVFAINLDSDLSTLSTTILDYYYNLYTALYYNLNLDTFYTEGYEYGYESGENFGYNDGYNDGLVEGYFDGQADYYYGTYLESFPFESSTGYQVALVEGYEYGYDAGFEDGLTSDVDTQWLLGFVSGTVNILGVSIIPGISLGVFVFIPLFLGFIGFIFRLGGRRG